MKVWVIEIFCNDVAQNKKVWKAGRPTRGRPYKYNTQKEALFNARFWQPGATRVREITEEEYSHLR